jgi:hypothetical protein
MVTDVAEIVCGLSQVVNYSQPQFFNSHSGIFTGAFFQGRCPWLCSFSPSGWKHHDNPTTMTTMTTNEFRISDCRFRICQQPAAFKTADYRLLITDYRLPITDY